MKLLCSQEGPARSYFASTDLTYAYNYEWTTWARPTHSTQYEREGWEKDWTNPRDFGMAAYWLPSKIHDEPNVGFQGLHQWRRRINNVTKVTRSMIVVRETKVPYVIFADDCEQPSSENSPEHEYTWAMAVANDVKLLSFDGTDAILFDDDDSRRRLVLRILSSCRGAPLKCELTRYQRENKKKRLPDGAFEKIDASRLIFTTRAGLMCNFNIALFPLASDNCSPPKTTWLSRNVLEVKYSETDWQVLEYGPSPGSHGETLIRVVKAMASHPS